MTNVRADSRPANFTRCKFHGGRFMGAKLQGADFSDAVFVGVNLDGAELRNGRGQGCVFDSCSMVGTVITGLEGAVYKNTDITKAIS
jgi:uncharacterized protein YjbI with pentapeptide repeats